MDNSNNRALAWAEAKTPNSDPDPRDDEARLASFFHESNKFRRIYVDADLFANPAWEIMLTLFLGGHDNVPVSRASLAAGNRLSDAECDAALDKLAARVLVEFPDSAPGRSTRVALTEIGRQRMRAFLRSASRDGRY